MNGVGRTLRVKNFDISFRSMIYLFVPPVSSLFNSPEFICIDTAEILMKRETGLNNFTISFDKYHFYKVNI